jgi:hypothetical protein
MEGKMTRSCEPDKQFVEKLEWQLASAYRRMNLMKPAGRIAVPRRLMAVAVSVGVLMTGVTLIKAAEYIKDSWRKKIEIARIETDVRIKEVRLDSAREMAARIASLASEGLVHQEESLAMKAAAEKTALDLEKSRLNLEEVRASGLVPRNELYAPLIRGRDFVGERIAVDKKQAELDLELLGSRLERLKKLVEKKLVQEDELNQEKVVFDQRKGILDGIQKRLGLRRQFINGELTAEEVDIQDRTAVGENNLRLAQRRVDSLVAQWKHFQGLEARGMVSSVESRQVRFALEAAEAELKLAALEIEVLAKVR